MSAERLPLPDASAFPPQILPLHCWAAWKYIERDGHRTKLPLNPHTGKAASSTDPATWGTFAEARAFAEPRGYGVELMIVAPLILIDMDDCLSESGELSPMAAAIVAEVDTYWEVSASRRGLKGIAYGTKPGGRCRRKGLKLEIYDHARPAALTGWRWDDSPLAVNDCTDAIAHIYGAAFPEQEPPRTTATPRPVADEDDRAIVDWLHEHRASTFSRLWHGPHGDDPSSDDLALCNLLAWRTGDEHRTDRLFRQSGLYREKWERTDYRERTIAKAFEGRTSFWEPPQRPTQAHKTHVDDSPRLARLEQRIEALERELATERQLRMRAQKTLTSVIQIRRNPHIKAERDTLVATVFDVMAEVAAKRVDSEGWVKLHTQRIADAAGKSPATVRNHAKVGADSKLWEMQLANGADPTTGERRTFYLIRPKDDPEKLLDVLVTLEPTRIDRKTGEEKDTWGGKREPCPRCGSTATRTVTYCAECDMVLSESHDDGEGPPEEAPTEAQATYPSAPLSEDDEPDDWIPGACNHRDHTGQDCTRRSLPEKRYCDLHDPGRLARFSRQRGAPAFAVADK